MARILVVDDEREIVDILREYLSRKGYAVSAAYDGPEAIQKLKEERPHVVLLDIKMPTMNGLEVLRHMRELDQEVGVIMITGVLDEETGRAALNLGAFDYITKPLDLTYVERSLGHKLALMTL